MTARRKDFGLDTLGGEGGVRENPYPGTTLNRGRLCSHVLTARVQGAEPFQQSVGNRVE